MDFNKPAQISNFLFACVYYLLGNYRQADDLLSDKESDLANYFKIFIGAQEDFNLKIKLKDRVEDQDNYNSINQNIGLINKELDNIIDKYFDEDKYNRSWFQFNKNNIIDEVEVNNRLEAIICYILRGYCSFRKSQQFLHEGLGASQKGLNDLAQAEFLWQDIYYYTRISSKGNSYSYSPGSFKESIKQQDGNDKMTYNSLLFVLRLLISFLKGNIYREIHFQENALDHYFNATRLFLNNVHITDRLYDNEKYGQFLYPIVAKSFYEVSKLLFDKGQMIESLIAQVKSIKYILMISSLKKPENNENAKDLFVSLKETIKNLKNIKESFREYFRKDIILSLFIDLNGIKQIQNDLQNGGKEIKTILLTTEEPLISPEKINAVSSLIADSLKPLLADVLARIGFTLYTIRLRIDVDKIIEDISDEEITKYNQYNNEIASQIIKYLSGYDEYESELGNYTRKLLGDKDVGFISPRIERVFCSSAIEELRKETENIQLERLEIKKWKEELKNGAAGGKKSNVAKKLNRAKLSFQSKLSAKLTIHSLTNVGNIAAIPFRIDHFLAQESYKERTKKRFGRSGINKLVILRRWQSFNPIVPRPKGQDIRGGGYFLIWNGKGIVIDPGYDFIQNFYEEGYSIGDIDAIIVTHTHPDHEDELNTQNRQVKWRRPLTHAALRYLFTSRQIE